jgi:hypothetical protein
MPRKGLERNVYALPPERLRLRVKLLDEAIEADKRWVVHKLRNGGIPTYIMESVQERYEAMEEAKRVSFYMIRLSPSSIGPSRRGRPPKAKILPVPIKHK